MEQQAPGTQGLARAGVSVFNCYNQLRLEIQALLAENRELSRAVRDLRERQQQQAMPAPGPASAPPAMPASAPPAVPINQHNPNSGGGLFQFPSIGSSMEWDLAPLEQNPAAHSTPRNPQEVLMAPASSNTSREPSASGSRQTSGPVEDRGSAPAGGSQLPAEPGSSHMRISELYGLNSGSWAVARPGTSQSHQDTSNASRQAGSQRDRQRMLWDQVVGEMAFQLDRRILSRVFPDRAHLYGYTVSNIQQKIVQAAMGPIPGIFNEEVCARAARRYGEVLALLCPLGYNPVLHPAFAEFLVNTYGILVNRGQHSARHTAAFVRHIIGQTVPVAMRHDAMVLLECLEALAQDDGQPLFIW